MLFSDRASTAIGELKQEYDLVVVDAPPVLPVADASLIAQHCDGVLFVARSGRSRVPDVAAAYVRLQVANLGVIGSVLNGVSDSASYYGYGGAVGVKAFVDSSKQT